MTKQHQLNFSDRRHMPIRHSWLTAAANHAMTKSIFIFIAVISLTLPAATAFAGQGVQRLLYTVPNTAFIEQPAGESVVTINDTSGSIVALQTAINFGGRRARR